MFCSQRLKKFNCEDKGQCLNTTSLGLTCAKTASITAAGTYTGSILSRILMSSPKAQRALAVLRSPLVKGGALGIVALTAAGTVLKVLAEKVTQSESDCYNDPVAKQSLIEPLKIYYGNSDQQALIYDNWTCLRLKEHITYISNNLSNAIKVTQANRERFFNESLRLRSRFPNKTEEEINQLVERRVPLSSTVLGEQNQKMLNYLVAKTSLESDIKNKFLESIKKFPCKGNESLIKLTCSAVGVSIPSLTKRMTVLGAPKTSKAAYLYGADGKTVLSSKSAIEKIKEHEISRNVPPEHRTQFYLAQNAAGEVKKAKVTVVLDHGLLNSPQSNQWIFNHIKQKYGSDVHIISNRLAGHYSYPSGGIGSPRRVLNTVTDKDWSTQAIEVQKIAEGLGDSVINIGHSTGGLMALEATSVATKPTSALLVAPAFRVRPKTLAQSATSYFGFSGFNDSHGRFMSPRAGLSVDDYSRNLRNRLQAPDARKNLGPNVTVVEVDDDTVVESLPQMMMLGDQQVTTRTLIGPSHNGAMNRSGPWRNELIEMIEEKITSALGTHWV